MAGREELGEAVVPIRAAMDKLDGDLEKAKGAFTTALKDIGKSFTETGKALSLTLTAPLVGAGGAALAVAMQFDDALDTIRVGTGATGEALGALGEDFRAVFREVPTSSAAAAQAIADLSTRTGLTGQALRDLAKQELELARITRADLGGQIAATTRVFGDWSVASDQQSRTLDLLFKVSQSTGIAVSDLANRLVQFGAPLRQLGFDLDTSAVLMGKFEKEGVNSDLVMGSLRIALTKMAQAGEEPVQTFQRMVQQIKSAGDAGKANALALEFFGARAGPDMAAAIREGRFEVGELLNSLRQSPETILSASKETAGFSENMILLKNRVSEALLPLGDTLLQTLERLQPQFEALVGHLQNAAQWFASLDPSTQTTILAMGALAAALGPVLVVLGAVVTAVGALLSPVGLVVLAVAALAAVALVVVKYWGPIQGFFTDLWTSISTTVMGAIHSVVNFIASAWNSIVNTTMSIWQGVVEFFAAIGNFISSTWDAIKQKTLEIWDGIKAFFDEWWPLLLAIFTGGLGLAVAWVIGHWDEIKAVTLRVWGKLKEFFGSVWDEIVSIFGPPLEALGDMLSSAWTSISDAAGVVWEGIKGFFVSVWDAIVEIFGPPIEAIGELLSSAWENIRSTSVSLWERIKNAVIGPLLAVKEFVAGLIRDAFNWGRDLLGRFLAGLRSMWESILEAAREFARELKKVLGFGGEGGTVVTGPVTPPDVPPGLAHGGRVRRAGMTLVGERGPELAFLPRGAEVFSSGASRALLAGAGAGGGSEPMVVILQVDGRELTRATLRHMPGEVTRAGGLF